MGHHPDTYPIGAALSVALSVGVYTMYHFITRDPDVMVAHTTAKSGEATIAYGDKLASETTRYNNSFFRKVASLRHYKANATGGEGWDTHIAFPGFQDKH